MCDVRGSEPGLAGAPCWALAVMVRARYPDASVQLVQDFENLMAAIINEDRGLNLLWQHNSVATVALVWDRMVADRL